MKELEDKILATFRSSSLLRLSSNSSSSSSSSTSSDTAINGASSNALTNNEITNILTSKEFIHIVEEVLAEFTSASASLSSTSTSNPSSSSNAECQIVSCLACLEAIIAHLQLSVGLNFKFSELKSISSAILIVSSKLQKLTKLKSHFDNWSNVLKTCVTILDENVNYNTMQFNDDNEKQQFFFEEGQVLGSICQLLFDLSAQSQQNVKYLNLSWKYLTKLATKFTDSNLRSNIPIAKIIEYLCQISLENFHYIFYSPSTTTRAFSQYFKLSQFYLVNLEKLVKNFSFEIKDLAPTLVNFIIPMKGLYFTAFAAKKNIDGPYEDLYNKCICLVDTMIVHLVDANNEFILQVFQFSASPELLAKFESFKCDFSVAKLMTVLVLLSKNSQQLFDLLVDNAVFLFSLIFACIEESKPAVLQGFQLCTVYKSETDTLSTTAASTSTPANTISLYQLILSALCSFIKKLPQTHVGAFESFLFQQLVSTSTLTLLLTTDLWCFFGKLVDDSFLLSHLLLLGKLLCASPQPSHHYQTIAMLISRLSSLLSLESVLTLLDSFDPASNLVFCNFWASISFRKETDEAVSLYMDRVLSPTMDVFSESLVGTAHEITLQLTLQLLNNSFSSNAVLSVYISNLKYQEITQYLIKVVYSSLNILDSLLTRKTLCLALNILASFIPYISESNVLSVIKPFDSKFSQLPLEVKFALSHFLSKCSSVTNSSDNELINTWNDLFLHLLTTDSCWLLLSQALVDVSTFIKFTQYSQQFFEKISKFPEIILKFQNFHQSIPSGKEQFEAIVVDFKEEQRYWGDFSAQLSQKESHLSGKFQTDLQAFQSSFSKFASSIATAAATAAAAAAASEKRFLSDDSNELEEIQVRKSLKTHSNGAGFSDSYFLKAIEDARIAIQSFTASGESASLQSKQLIIKELLALQESAAMALKSTQQN